MESNYQNDRTKTQNSQRPAHIELTHWSEGKKSAIAPDLMRLNIRSFLENFNPDSPDPTAYEYLLYAVAPEKLHTNTGHLRQSFRLKYQHLQYGGWWISGLDPDTNFTSEMDFGRFKPNRPRRDSTNKIIKYENPLSPAETRVGFYRVPLWVWQRVATRYNVAMPEHIVVTETGEAIGFWSWVLSHKEIPIILTEGEKKALCVLSNGFVVIALPGINSGYRKAQNPTTGRFYRHLQRDLAQFANGREFYICFDFDQKQSTRRNVNCAIHRLGGLLEELENTVKVIRLPGPEKGVDDFIIAQGPEEFEKLYDSAHSLHLDKILSLVPSLTHKPDYLLEGDRLIEKSGKKYLGDIPLPNAGLAFIKAPKGIGKTEALSKTISEAMSIGRPVIFLTYRIQLGKQVCARYGLHWISEQDGDFTKKLWFGCCVDSAWKIKAENYENAIVIIDECDQVVWHWLASDTCKEKRTHILASIQNLLGTVHQSGGLIVGMSADVNDTVVNYLRDIIGSNVKPWIALCDYKPAINTKVYHYDFSNPARLIREIKAEIAKGGRPYICTDAKEGRYSARSLHQILSEEFPQLKILCVDAQTSTTPGHPAVGFVDAINQQIQHWDIVIATPSIGSGVSIDVQSHFTAVFGLFLGVVPDWEARQALARVRESIPRHVWASKKGLGWVKGTRRLTNWKQIIQVVSQNSLYSAILNNLVPATDANAWLSGRYNPSHIEAWAKIAAAVNASMWNYRTAIWAGLISEGFTVEVVSDAALKDELTNKEIALENQLCNQEDEQQILELRTRCDEIRHILNQETMADSVVSQKMKESTRQRHIDENEAVAKSEEFTETEYLIVKDKRLKTDAERYSEQKYQIQQMYGVPITASLVQKNKKGYYSQIQRHFFATHNRDWVKLRDQKEWTAQLTQGNGQLYFPDLKHLQLQTEALDKLGVLAWAAPGRYLDPECVISKNDPELIQFCLNLLQYERDIKNILGVDIKEHRPDPDNTEELVLNPVGLLNRLLGLIGLKYKAAERIKLPDDSRLRLYRPDTSLMNDERTEIFPVWQQRWQEAWVKYQRECNIAIPCPLNSISNTPQQKVVDTAQDIDSPEKGTTDAHLKVGAVVRWVGKVGEWVVKQVNQFTAFVYRLGEKPSDWQTAYIGELRGRLGS